MNAYSWKTTKHSLTAEGDELFLEKYKHRVTHDDTLTQLYKNSFLWFPLANTTFE